MISSMHDSDIIELNNNYNTFFEQYEKDGDDHIDLSISSMKMMAVKGHSKEIRSILTHVHGFNERKAAIHRLLSTRCRLLFSGYIVVVIPKRYLDMDTYDLMRYDMYSSPELIYYFKQTPELCLKHIKNVCDIGNSKKSTKRLGFVLNYITIPIEGDFLREINRMKILGV